MPRTLVRPPKTNGVSENTITLPSIEKMELVISIVGVTPLVSNRFPDEQLAAMEKKITGDAGPNTRGSRDIELSAQGSAYKMPGDADIFAHPAAAVFQAVIEAHRKGAPYTKKALEQGWRISQELMPLEADARIRRDALKNSNGHPDLRYRMEYSPWATVVEVVLYPRVLSVNQFAQAIRDAGEFVGIGPKYMRKSFGFGRFTVEAIEPK